MNSNPITTTMELWQQKKTSTLFSAFILEISAAILGCVTAHMKPAIKQCPL